jgi:hypothetical protein
MLRLRHFDSAELEFPKISYIASRLHQERSIVHHYHHYHRRTSQTKTLKLESGSAGLSQPTAAHPPTTYTSIMHSSHQNLLYSCIRPDSTFCVRELYLGQRKRNEIRSRRMNGS